MAITRSNGGADAGASNAEGSTDENLCNLIAEEISREVLAAIPQFFGTMSWLLKAHQGPGMQAIRTFRLVRLRCSMGAGIQLSACDGFLREGAKDWWEIRTKDLTPAQLDAITWLQFKEQFKLEYVSQVEMERLAQEYLNLTQTTETVTEITKKFNERALFCLEFAATERMNMTRYLEMLRTDIRKFVSAARHQSLTDMIMAARA
ncbi:hypothetical protein L2E82_45358 [Cichorium intybus]|uniref:Uncharacterized protein n=1 Tax=Cichorium intybus TaxID=13427 RepID=A0ACB8ZX59_CICIN|nr:hypothetical protein L2E82_45358 [Cichorium intybus]